jgi:hypothetical protein
MATQTWSVYEIELKKKKLNVNFRRGLKNFLNKKKLASKVGFDKKNKKFLRFAVHTNAIKDNPQILEITTWINERVKTRQITFPGQMIKTPDLTKPIPKAA